MGLDWVESVGTEHGSDRIHHHTDGRKIFRMVLRALEMPLGLLFLSGQWHGWKDQDKGAPIGFSSLPFAARERIIGALLTSPIAPTRGVRTAGSLPTPQHTLISIDT